MLPTTGEIVARASQHLHATRADWVERCSPLVSRGSSWSEAPQQLTDPPGSSTVVGMNAWLPACPCASATHLGIQKHLQRGGRGSTTMLQKPVSSTSFLLLLQSLLQPTHSHSGSQLVSFKLLYKLWKYNSELLLQSRKEQKSVHKAQGQFPIQRGG